VGKFKFPDQPRHFLDVERTAAAPDFQHFGLDGVSKIASMAALYVNAQPVATQARKQPKG
jgi:hypothetical protein